MKKIASYTLYALYIYMASYFVLNGVFLHNHIIDGENISHSHPLKGKEHNSGEAQIIHIFNTTFGIAPEEIYVPTSLPTKICCIDSLIIDNYRGVSPLSKYTRGPPHFC